MPGIQAATDRGAHPAILNATKLSRAKVDIPGKGANAVLAELRSAVRRRHADKIHAQSRMKENGKALFAWLEEGGYFYVCGDATRMARDVDTALGELIAEHGGLSDEDAAAYVANLKREKRYLRDVY